MNINSTTSFFLNNRNNFQTHLNGIKQDNSVVELPLAKMSVDNYKSNFLTFKGNIASTMLCKSPTGNCSNLLKHQTAFFRDPETVEFVANYVKSELKDKKDISIADFGCAVGEEAYTLAMLMNDSKVKITGYDVANEILQLADRGIYTICSKEETNIFDTTNLDSYLNQDNAQICSGKMKKFHELFHNSFREIKNLPRDLKENRHFKTVSDKRNEVQKYYEIDKSTLRSEVNFDYGNISNIPEVLKAESTDVLVFKNALYHLFPEQTDSQGYINSCLDRTSKVFKDINEALKPGGLFVFGRLAKDHRATPAIFKDRNGEKVDNLKIHNLLRENGFEPVFYDRVEKEYGDMKTSIYLPSVWKKVDE